MMGNGKGKELKGDNVLCPKCKKKIKYLNCVMVVDEVIDCKFSKEGIESDFIFNPNAYSVSGFFCPLCDEHIDINEYEAEKLLK